MANWASKGVEAAGRAGASAKGEHGKIQSQHPRRCHGRGRAQRWHGEGGTQIQGSCHLGTRAPTHRSVKLGLVSSSESTTSCNSSSFFPVCTGTACNGGRTATQTHVPQRETVFFRATFNQTAAKSELCDRCCGWRKKIQNTWSQPSRIGGGVPGGRAGTRSTAAALPGRCQVPTENTPAAPCWSLPRNWAGRRQACTSPRAPQREGGCGGWGGEGAMGWWKG
jgi:hypothetical protein